MAKHVEGRYLAYDVISEVGFGGPFGFIETGTDVGDLIKSFHDGLLVFGLMARVHPFTTWITKTWVGERYLVAKPEDNSGIGTLMRFRDKLIDQRIKDIDLGIVGGRMDLLQA